jgi:hypothetical protein
MNFFKKKQGNKETKEQKPAGEQKDTRKYFEVFGDLVKFDNFKTSVIIVLLGIIVLLLLLLRIAITRPPIVIRVNPDGSVTAFKNVLSYQNTTKAEVLNFVQLFLSYYTQLNFYSLEDDFSKAEKMMSQKMKQIAIGNIRANDIQGQVKRDEIKTVMEIKSISITKVTPKYIGVRITGHRDKTSYKDPTYFKTEGFDIEMAILLTERTENHPYGLLVDNFKDTLY